MTAVLEKTELSQDARELAGKAADAIRERGWGRVVMCSTGGELCLVGAIAGAAVGLNNPADVIDDAGWQLIDDADTGKVSPGVEVVREVLHRIDFTSKDGVKGAGVAWEWNDSHSDPAEILALLDDIAGR